MSAPVQSEWLKKGRIYQILIDRFAGVEHFENTQDFLGGNFRAITEKLDYIKELGINTIWLSPFWKTNQYHGYHIVDYEITDPHFGSINELKILIKTAHKKSLKIITDFVPNHCSSKHPFFTEAQTNKYSSFYPWFCFTKWPKDYLCFLNVKELPKLNLNHQEAGDYMINIAKFWLSIGIDGFRIDHVIGPSRKFWKRFYREIKLSYPDCILLGEAWGEGINREFYKTIHIKNKFWHKLFGISQESIQKQYIEILDGVLDFRLNQIITDGVRNGIGFSSNEGFLKKVVKHFKHYPENFHLITFLDNHDMNRFLFHCNGDVELLLEAIEFLLKLNKPLIIYYGTEMGFFNKDAVQINVPYSDLRVREPVNWDKIDYELYNRIRALMNKYKLNPVNNFHQ